MQRPRNKVPLNSGCDEYGRLLRLRMRQRIEVGQFVVASTMVMCVEIQLWRSHVIASR
jgi:hypothetical protein